VVKIMQKQSGGVLVLSLKPYRKSEKKQADELSVLEDTNSEKKSYFVVLTYWKNNCKDRERMTAMPFTDILELSQQSI